MKILLTTYEVYDRGGTAQRAWRVARDLTHMNHSVTLLCEPLQPQFDWRTTQENNVTIVTHPSFGSQRWRKSGLSPVSTLMRIFFIVKRNKNYSHFYGFGHRPSVSIPSLVARIVGYTVVADWCDFWGWSGIGSTRTGIAGVILRVFDTITENLYYRFIPHHITTISRFLMQKTLKWRPPDQVSLLGLPLPTLRPLSTLVPSLEKIEFGYSTSSHHDTLFLLRTLITLQKSFGHHKQEWLIHFLGPTPPWYYLVRALHLEKHIRFYGFVSHEQSLLVLKRCNAFLLPFPPTLLNQARVPNKILDYYPFHKPIFTQHTGDILLLTHKIPWIIPFLKDSSQEYANEIVSYFFPQMKKNKLSRSVYLSPLLDSLTSHSSRRSI